MIKFGALMDPTYPPSEFVELAKKLENWGFSSFWYPDEKYFRDCYVSLTQVAQATKKIRLGPCVTDPYSRHPISTAASVASLAEIAPSRVVLGLGAGGRGLEEIGIERRKPVVALREAVEIIRGLLAGDTVDYSGDVILLDSLPLDFNPPKDIKILIGTGHGPLIQGLAGEIADLVMFANFASTYSINKALTNVKKGVEKGNRSLSDVPLVSRIDVAVSKDMVKAQKAIAPRILSSVRASYPRLSYLKYLPDFDLSSKLIQVLMKKDNETKAHYWNPDHSYPLIPDTLFQHLAIAGTPDYVTERMRAISDMNIFSEITILMSPCRDQKLIEAYQLFKDQVMSNL